MKVEELKRGDRIKVIYSSAVHNAKVLGNYKSSRLIHFRLCGVFFGIRTLAAYKSSYFELIKE